MSQIQAHSSTEPSICTRRSIQVNNIAIIELVSVRGKVALRCVGNVSMPLRIGRDNGEPALIAIQFAIQYRSTTDVINDGKPHRAIHSVMQAYVQIARQLTAPVLEGGVDQAHFSLSQIRNANGVFRTDFL